MEISCQKHTRSSKKRKRYNKRRKSMNFEVKFSKQTRPHRTLDFENKVSFNNMEAHSFWQNYNAAQDWQNRHTTIWWRTRCYALEHENSILKDKIRSLVSVDCNKKFYTQTENHGLHSSSEDSHQDFQTGEEIFSKEEEQEDLQETEDDLVFQVDEEMLQFLEQSMKHKIELKKKRESEKQKDDENQSNDCPSKLEGGQNWVKERTECAELLYGEASSRILAMETALQATNERHVDKAKPQLWPNIPLNLKFD